MDKLGEIRNDLTPPEDNTKRAADDKALEEHLTRRLSDHAARAIEQPQKDTTDGGQRT